MTTSADVDHTIVDFAAHCHIYGPEPFTAAAIKQELGEPVYNDIEAYEKHYDRAEIDRAVLSQSPFMGGTDVAEVERANDTLLDVIETRERFYGLASLPTGFGGEEAAAEFERCLDRGVNGAAIETSSSGTEVYHRELDPVFEVANRSGAPIFVHPKLNDSIGSDMIDDSLYLNAVMGRDVALAISICKVVHSDILDRFPDLNLVYHHFGGNIASTLSRMNNLLRKVPPEIRADNPPESIKTYDEFKTRLEDRIYIDTSGYYGDRQVLRSATQSFPTSQLLFGTDFPYETRTTEDFQRMKRSIIEEMPTEDAEAILSGNAIRLLVNR